MVSHWLNSSKKQGKAQFDEIYFSAGKAELMVINNNVLREFVNIKHLLDIMEAWVRHACIQENIMNK